VLITTWQLEPVAGRIADNDEITDTALVGQRARAALDRHAGLFEPRGDGVERRGIRHLPAEEAQAFAAIGIDDDALLAVVHAEGEPARALVDALQAEQPAAVAAPVAQILGADPDISKRLGGHSGS
jgi:hypothetical protein